MELTKGIIGKKELTVTADKTAAAVGSGLLDVFATPRMIALMEATASESVAPYLDEAIYRYHFYVRKSVSVSQGHHL